MEFLTQIEYDQFAVEVLNLMFLQRVLASDSLRLEQDDDVLDRFKLVLLSPKIGQV